MKILLEVTLFILVLVSIGSLIHESAKKPKPQPDSLGSTDTTINGMGYTIFVSGTGQLQVINKTKDSLEVDIQKRALWDGK